MGATGFNFVGLENYVRIFRDDLALAGIKNSLLFTVFAVCFVNVCALFLSLVLDMDLKAKNVARVCFYIPCLICPVVLSAIFGDILQYYGLLNELWRQLGLDFLINDWFGNKTTALPMIMLLNLWQYAGYGAIIYLAGLQTIPEHFHEAAKIDGASKFAIFRHITLPLLVPSITIMTFFSITGGLKYFDVPYILTNGGPGTATEMVGTVIYKVAFKYNQLGYATAISAVLFLAIFIFAAIQLNYTRKREVEL
jgi:raffinose/stachyose/melibiose transport system permease protein